MTGVVLQLMGGPLDGLFLPVTPGAATPPRQLIIFSPLNTTWSNYVDRKRRVGATDVYKIKGGAKLPIYKPTGYKAVDMHYLGAMSAEAAKTIEDMARSRRLD